MTLHSKYIAPEDLEGAPNFRDMLRRLGSGHDLSMQEAGRAFQIVLHGGATPAQMSALLTALHMKGETADEISGAASALRHRMLSIPSPTQAIDTCGTGGDGTDSVNISTAVALVIAGCGVPVAKHGNRSVSSRSGSADVLEALGVSLNLSPEGAARILAECGIVFLMAPLFHPSLRHIAPVRRELGFRTIMNLLGPLCNPAGVKRQLLGVSSSSLLEPMAESLRRLGCEYAWVVHGSDGSDELSLTGSTEIIEVRPEGLHYFTATAADAGLSLPEDISLAGGEAQANARALTRLLEGQEGAYRQAVLLNAAAALIVAGKASDLAMGASLAAQAIDQGHAKQTLAQLMYLSQIHSMKDPA